MRQLSWPLYWIFGLPARKKLHPRAIAKGNQRTAAENSDRELLQLRRVHQPGNGFDLRALRLGHFDTGHGAAAKNAERTQAGRRASADRSDTTLGAGASEARNRTLVRPNGTEAGLVETNPQFNGLTAWGSAEGQLRIMKQPTKQFALCIDNVGNEASLILGKVYRIIPDPRAAKDDLVRIIDVRVDFEKILAARVVESEPPQRKIGKEQ